MAQFLDVDLDSDEDFEETVQQSKFLQDFHFGLEKCNTMAKIQFVFVTLPQVYPSQSSPSTDFTTPALLIISDQGNALHEAAQPLTRTACVTRPNWLGA